ncbi:MAG: hypothetical protein NTW10_11985 [Bacteroidetes bacterium]|nr:hypothetical protein [Bacteroidota bacterium]
MRNLLLILLLFSSHSLCSQDIYLPPANKEIENFLDELASEHVIELNSVIKPYSRAFIRQKLTEAKDKLDKLNRRQKEELRFYIETYSPKTSKPISFSANPISIIFSTPPLPQERGPGGEVNTETPPQERGPGGEVNTVR